MFEQLAAPDHVIALCISGKMTVDDIKQYRSLFEEKLANHGRVSALFDLTGLSDISATGLVEGTKADLELFSHFGQLARLAMISDKEWIQAVFSFVAPLLGTVELKAFAPDQRDHAIKWVAELPAHKELPPSIRLIPTSSDDVFAFEINGVISAKDLPGFIDQFNVALEHHDKIRVLNRVRHLGGFDPAVFMQSGLVSMKLAAMQKVERYAIVGAPGWMSKVIDTVNPMFPDIDIRNFPASQEADAWTWLGAKPSE